MRKNLRLLICLALLTLLSASSWAGVDFNGDADKIDLPNLGVSGGTARTISFWANVGTKNGIMNFFGWGENALEAQCVLHFDVMTDNLYWAFAANDYYTGNNILTRGTWYHIACVYDGGTLSTSTIHIYINGVSQGLTKAGPGSGSANTTDAGYAIAFDYGSDAGRYFDGKISEFAIWDVALTQDEITLLAKSKVKGMPYQLQPSNLITYIPLDDLSEGAGINAVTFKDRGRNGNDGTGVDGDADSSAVAEEVLSYAMDICYVHAVAAVGGWAHKWNGIPAANIAKINTVPRANIAKVNGI